MADNKQNPRNYSAQDQLFTEIDRLLAITAAKPRSFANPQPDSGRARNERSGASQASSLRDQHLRASHSNATAALGLRRGLRLAARSASTQKSAEALEQQALAAQASIERQLQASSVTAGIGYAAGLALGLSSRLFGDETGRKLSGSLNQLAIKAQSQRARELSKTDPELTHSLNQQVASLTCACGPHGHRTRSTIASRALSKSAGLLERLSRF